jgi:AAA15 family ATPase/GTPase
MILEFSIENTYSIKDRQTISFEAADDSDDQHIINVGNKKLLKLAAIYGANASGKTNILSALDYYRWFILNSFSLPPCETTRFIPFLFDDYKKQSPGNFEIVFFMDDKLFTYNLMIDSHVVHNEQLFYNTNGQQELVFERNLDVSSIDNDNLKYGWNWGDVLDEEKTTVANMTRANTTFLNTSAQFGYSVTSKIHQHLTNILLPLINPATTGLFAHTADMIEENIDEKDNILSLIKKSDIGTISDILIKKREYTQSLAEQFDVNSKPQIQENRYIIREIFLSHLYGKEIEIPITDESRGTQRLFALAGILLEAMKNNKLVSIDEIESSLHDDLIEFFIRSFIENTKESQLLFTTHNQTLLDYPLLRNDEVWFAQKDSNGGSEFFSLTEFKDVPENVSRRELYKAGAFGALPHTARFSKD